MITTQKNLIVESIFISIFTKKLLSMSKYISQAFFRDITSQYLDGGMNDGITFDRMLELIETEVINNYDKSKLPK